MKKDKIEILNERLKEVKEKFEALQKCGVDGEILTIYLQHKTKLSKKKVREFLRNLEDFYRKLIKTTIIESLEDKQ
jgi:hypothetical protein